MERLRLYICKVLIQLLLVTTTRSQLMGGFVTWKTINGSPDQIYIEQTFVHDGVSCEQARLAALEASIICDEGGSTCVAHADVGGTCVKGDSEENWSIRYLRRVYANHQKGPYTLLFVTVGDDGGIDLLYPMYVNTESRSDTGKSNTPPILAQDAVIRLKHGCEVHVPIKVFDADGDVIQCRIASGESECGNFCNTLEGTQFTLNQTTCTILYSGEGPSSETTRISLIIEDHPHYTITVGDSKAITSSYLSFVPLQFHIEVYASDSECNTKPAVMDSAGAVELTLFVQEHFNVTLTATKSNTSDAVINKFTVLGIPDIEEMSIISEGNDTFSHHLSWKPVISDFGLNVLCYTVEDANRDESNRHCLALNVTENSEMSPDVMTTNADLIKTTMFTSTTSQTSSATTEPDPCSINNGNCSDACLHNGGSDYECSCINPCWHLAIDERNCIPKVVVECVTNDFLISVEKCSGIGVAKLSGYIEVNDDLIPTTCRSTSNTTHTTFQFGLHECATSVKESGSDIKYENSIHLWITSNSSAVITRGALYAVSTVCTYEKNASVSGSYNSNSLEFAAIPGLGYFTFDFIFYGNSRFEGPLESDSLIFSPASDIYFTLKAAGGSGLRLFTEMCNAFPYNGGFINKSGLSYSILKNGCFQDSTMKAHDSINKMENRFSIKAFRFLDTLPMEANNEGIVIECLVMICVDEPSTRCNDGCIESGRSKRSIIRESILHHQINRIKRGEQIDPKMSESPEHVMESDSFRINNDEKDGWIEWSWIFLLIVATVGMCVSCVMCCKIIFIHRRKKKQISKQSDVELHS